jgi:flagellar protein FlaG
VAREVITTSLLVIASVVAVTAVLLSIFPTIREVSSSFTSLSKNLNDKVETDFEIIFIKAQSQTGTITLNFWMKNTGETKISQSLIENTDVFIVSSNTYLHYTLSDTNVSYTIENGDSDSYWEKTETMSVSIQNISDTEMPSGEYELTVVLYNGVKASDLFSV